MMKKAFYLFLIIGLSFIGCNKPETIPTQQDVLFKAAAVVSGFKSDDNACNAGIAHYALIIIQPLAADGITESGDLITKRLEIFYLNGTMYTNTLKLLPGKYKLTSFILMNDAGTPLDTSDDTAVYATPGDDSTFGSLINSPLPLTFDVGAFMKNEVPIQVLCFEPADYDKFGFTWFALDVVTVNDNGFCFFGDICLDESDLAYYNGHYNLYKAQINGVRHDMPAIFRMKVSRWTPVEPNLGTPPNNDSQMWVKLQDITNLKPQGEEYFPLYGEGSPLCVQNFEVSGDIIRYSLWVYMRETTQGEYWNTSYDDLTEAESNGFRYRFVKSWYSTDTDKPVDNGDGIIDFVIGDCNPDADLVIKYENISN